MLLNTTCSEKYTSKLWTKMEKTKSKKKMPP